MIESGDLSKLSRIQVLEGEFRTKWRPWRKAQAWRTVGYGYINRVESDSEGMRFLIDSMSNRLRNHWQAYV